MSFINEIDNRAPRPPSNPSPGFSDFASDLGQSASSSATRFINEIDITRPIVRVQDEVSNLLNPQRITGAIGDAASGFVQRSVDSLGRSIKTVIDEQVAKRATNPIRDALGRAAGGLLGDFFEGFLDEGQNIPPQYSGVTNQESPMEEFFHGDLYAMTKYRLDESSDAINDAHPMMKYMFLADFVFNSGEYFRTNKMRSFPSSLTLSLKNTTFPKMEIETDEINQYNRHIVSPRRVRYQPITSTFGESVSHIVEGSNKSSMLEIWDTIASYYVNDFKNPDADFLYTPLGSRSGNDLKHLIKYIDLYMIWPSSTKRIRIVNPFLTSFSYDNLDYGSDEQIMATFDIKYEYYQMVEVRGNFINFINSPAGASIFAGSPFELVQHNTARNLSVVQGDDDVDDQRMTNLDNPYAQATLQLAEQEAINAAKSLLGSNDPVKRELGRQAVERSLDAGQSLAQTTGIFQDVQDAVRDIGRDAGRSTSSFISGLF